MTTADDTSATDRYLAAVRAELADLQDDERSDLLEDVEQHLLEVSAEADGPLDTVLGPPAQYAAELRSAAGLPPRGADEEAGGRISRLVRRDIARLHSSRTYQGIRDFLPELRPGWWVLRGYLVTMWFGAVTSSSDSFSLVPFVADNPLLGLIVLTATVVASVKLGRRPPRQAGARWALVAAGVFVVIAAVVTGIVPRGTHVGTSYAYNGGPSGLYGLDGEITNIYAYSPDGKPLDVLLYDQDGRPITTGDHDPYDYAKRDMDQSTAPKVGNLFPKPAPIIDPFTGDVIGERPRPVIVPPAVGATPSPTPTATAAATATPSAKPKPTKTR